MIRRALSGRGEELLALAALAGSLVLNYFAGSYADMAGNAAVPSPDLAWRALPLVDLRHLYGWGFGGFVAAAVLCGCFRERRRAAFIAWSYALLIAVRCFCMVLTPMQLPPEAVPVIHDPIYLWVGRFVTFRNDLFFSSHTAMPYLAFLVYRGRWIKRGFLAISILMAATVILGRLHYSIDVVGAYFITYAVHQLNARRLLPLWSRLKERLGAGAGEPASVGV